MRVLARSLAVAAIVVAAPVSAHAALKTETVLYKHGEAVLEGYLAWDDAKEGPRPAVLVVHDWMGVGQYAKKRVEILAEMGYVAFAADIYGKGIRPQNPQEAAAQAGKYKGDRTLMRARVRAALERLLEERMADAKRVAAIGYCFGGTTILELARSGAPLTGAVSFHGGLGTPTPADAKKIRAKVLVLHGADDPHVPADEVAAFEKEMRDAKVDWQLIAYGGAVHAFTNPDAGTDASRGAAYDATADRRSWVAMKVFFTEIFK